MRVLFVTTSYPRFEGDHCGPSVYRLATMLASHGHTVHVVAPHDAGACTDENHGQLRVTRMRYWIPEKHQRLAYAYGIPQNMRRNPLAACQVPFLLFSIGVELCRLASRYDVVHAHWISAAVAALPASRFCRKPLVVTIRGSDARCLPEWLTRLILSKVQRTIVPSIQLQEDLSALSHFPPVLIPNPVEDHLFRPGRRAPGLNENLSIPRDASVVTFVARLYDFKDPLTLVRAIPLVLSGRRNVFFLFVGDGPLRREIHVSCRALGVASNVRTLGARGDVADILAISDVFVAISRVENVWSNTITEAMMCGVPCVISDAGYSAKVFHDGIDARVVEAGNAASVAHGILGVLENSDLQEKLRQGARRLLTRWGFERREILARTLHTYGEALQNYANHGKLRKRSCGLPERSTEFSRGLAGARKQGTMNG